MTDLDWDAVAERNHTRARQRAALVEIRAICEDLARHLPLTERQEQQVIKIQSQIAGVLERASREVKR